MAEKVKTVICPNPSCGKETIVRYKRDDRDRDDICSACGVMVRVPADFAKPVTMFTVQVGDGPKKPIIDKRFLIIERDLTAFC